MSLTGRTNEEKIWNYLESKGLNDYGVAGLMGNLYAESALRPQNLQGTYEKKLGFTDAEYTAAVDSGNYTDFVHDSAGYGLAQWTYWTRKEALLDYARASGKSIGDLEMQLEFLHRELSRSYAAVLAVLKKATSVKEASDIVVTKFERPADQSEKAKEKRAGYGQKYYDKYAKVESSGDNTGSNTSAASGSALAYKVGDVVQFIGKKHYTNANALLGKACKAGKAKVTAVHPTGKHPYHVVAVSGSGSNVYGWVNAADVGTVEITVGDVVQFLGGPHYTNPNAKTYKTSPKAGPAKVTAIKPGTTHPYHVIHTDKQSAVYGWVDDNKVKK